ALAAADRAACNARRVSFNSTCNAACRSRFTPSSRMMSAVVRAAVAVMMILLPLVVHLVAVDRRVHAPLQCVSAECQIRVALLFLLLRCELLAVRNGIVA